jgi:exonuclease SbcC
MRILSVKFKNLNSLKGEHKIDFNGAPFSESGLFAITGPTGAGKTTILDAITVALYGKVHRHNKDVEEIMSRHTGECYAEVEFESKGLVYMAKWSLSRARGKADGKMQSERMELAELTEAGFVMIGEHTPTLIKKQIEELCGLDYAQFLRSVILSQGDFTRFLKSTDRERSELLENITGTEVYSEISMFVFRKEKEERDKLTTLQQKLGDVKLLSTEERAEYEEQLTKLAAQENNTKARQTSTQTAISWLEGIQKLANRKVNLEAELDNLVSRLLLNQDDFESLKWHQKADKYKLPYRSLTQHIEEETLLKNKIAAIALEVPVLEAKVADAIRQGDIASSKLTEAENNQDLLNPVIDQALQKDEEIKNLNNMFESYTTELNAIQPAITNTTTQKQNLEIRLGDLTGEIAALQSLLNERLVDATLDKQLLIFNQHAANLLELRADLQKARLLLVEDESLLNKVEVEIKQINHGIDTAKKSADTLEEELKLTSLKAAEALQGQTFELLETETNSLPGLISNYQLLYESAEAIKKTRQDYLALKAMAADLEKQLILKNAGLVKLNEDLEAAKKLSALHQRLVDAEQQIQNYEVDRLKLLEGEPCMLCGSVHHPFVTDGHQQKLSEAQQQLSTQQLRVESLTKQVFNSTVEIERIQASLENFHLQLKEKAKAGTEIKAKFLKLNESIVEVMDIDQPENIKLILEDTKVRWTMLKERLQHSRQLRDALSELQTRAEGYKTNILTQQGQLGVLKAQLNGLRDRMGQSHLMVMSLREKEIEEVAWIKQMLIPYGLDFNSEHLDYLSTTLSLRNEQYLNASKKLLEKQEALINLNKALDPLSFKLEEQQRQFKKVREQADQAAKELSILKQKRLALFGSRDPIIERTRIAAEIKTLAQSKEAAIRGLQDREKALSETAFNLKQHQESLLNMSSKKDNMQSELIQLLALEGIESIDALTTLLLPDDRALELSELKRQLDEAIVTTKDFIKQNLTDLQNEKLKQLTTSDAETLRLQLSELNDEISIHNQEIGRFKAMLDADAKLGLQHLELSKNLKLQQTVLLKWSNLNTLIGSSDGQKFRLFAQGLTLARLTELANQHLVQLTDRYTILKGKEDLLLLIEDRYQAGAVRPMATLSGGESFLVSLALALGLSDLASHKVQINSLFIDEGFGTLDADTLDVAISALENLQSKGKTIGIISHVEALKERIGTQVQIIKQPGGSSKIRIQDYGKTVLDEFLN